MFRIGPSGDTASSIVVLSIDMMHSFLLYKGKQISFYVARDFFTKNNFAPVKALHTPAKAILNEPSGRGAQGATAVVRHPGGGSAFQVPA